MERVRQDRYPREEEAEPRARKEQPPLLALQRAAGNAAVARMLERRTLQRRYRLREDESADTFVYGWVADDNAKPVGHYQWAGEFPDLGDLLRDLDKNRWIAVKTLFGKSRGKVWTPDLRAPYSHHHEIVKQAEQNLRMRMTKREPAPTGDIGRMDFRFERSKGTLYYVDRLPVGYRPQPDVLAIPVDAKTLEERILQARMDRRFAPRENEYKPGEYLYLRRPSSMVGDDMKPAQERNRIVFLGEVHTPEDFKLDKRLHQRLLQAADEVDRLVELRRVQEVTFTREAKGMSRDGGQVHKMAGMNAAAYALARNLPNALATPWEWLHIRGARLGGATSAANLVAGTAATNSHMIPYENWILQLSRLADEDHPLRVVFSVETYGTTRLPLAISITYHAPNGLVKNGHFLQKRFWQGGEKFNPVNGQIIDRTSRDLMWDPPRTTPVPPRFDKAPDQGMAMDIG